MITYTSNLSSHLMKIQQYTDTHLTTLIMTQYVPHLYIQMTEDKNMIGDRNWKIWLWIETQFVGQHEQLRPEASRLMSKQMKSAFFHISAVKKSRPTCWAVKTYKLEDKICILPFFRSRLPFKSSFMSKVKLQKILYMINRFIFRIISRMTQLWTWNLFYEWLRLSLLSVIIL